MKKYPPILDTLKIVLIVLGIMLLLKVLGIL